jgi:zinc protease
MQANILAGQVVNSTADDDLARFRHRQWRVRRQLHLAHQPQPARGQELVVRLAQLGLQAAKGQRPWIISAPVQIDRTMPTRSRKSSRELAEFTGELTRRPDEVDKIRKNRIRGLPGQYETAGAVLGAIGGIVSYQLAGRPRRSASRNASRR